MKCPKCSQQHKHADGMTCSCGHGFVLDPKVDGISDGEFWAAYKRATGNNTYFVTTEQIETAHLENRHSPLSPFVAIMWGAVASLLLWIFVRNLGVSPPIVFLVASVPITFAIVLHGLLPLAGPRPRVLTNETERIRLAIAKHSGPKRATRVPGLEKLLGIPELKAPPGRIPESDLFDYGVERILIVPSNRLVDLLVKNGFHATERTLVLSANGYPAYLAEKLGQLLSTSPKPPVFLFSIPPEIASGIRGTADSSFSVKDADKFVKVEIPPQVLRRLCVGNKEPTLEGIPYPALSGILSNAFLQRAQDTVVVSEKSSVYLGDTSFG